MTITVIEETGVWCQSSKLWIQAMQKQLLTEIIMSLFIYILSWPRKHHHHFTTTHKKVEEAQRHLCLIQPNVQITKPMPAYQWHVISVFW